MTDPKEMRLLRLKMNEEKQNQQGIVVEHFEAYGMCRDSRRIAHLEGQLEQAKALIKEMLPYMPKENIEGVYEIVTHAEEFIKE